MEQFHSWDAKAGISVIGNKTIFSRDAGNFPVHSENREDLVGGEVTGVIPSLRV